MKLYLRWVRFEPVSAKLIISLHSQSLYLKQIVLYLRGSELTSR